MRETTEQASNLPDRDEFEQVMRLLDAPAQHLIEIMGAVQASRELRPIGDRVFQLLSRLLVFTHTFERELKDVASYYEAWLALCRQLGHVPERDRFEEWREWHLAEDAPVEPEPPPLEEAPFVPPPYEPAAPTLEELAEPEAPPRLSAAEYLERHAT